MGFWSTEEIEQKIGQSIKTLRLQRDIDRETLCTQSGASLNALKRLEDGQGVSLKTLIKILVSLEKQDWIFALAPQITINPLRMPRSGKQRSRATRSKRPEKSDLEHKRDYLLRTYGLTVEQYVKMFDFQNGLCGNPGCKDSLDLQSSKTHVDHCHATGKVRSLLCSGCNTALGLIQENGERAIGLANYLKRYNKNEKQD